MRTLPPTCSTASCRRAFTIVEILVVITIMAVLVTLLLPAMNNARLTASTLKCSANFRGLALSMFMYQGDNKNLMPTPSTMGATSLQGADFCKYSYGWAALVGNGEYIQPVTIGKKSPELTGCPGRTSVFRMYGDGSKGGYINNPQGGNYAQITHVGYRFNAVPLDTEWGMRIARNEGDHVVQNYNSGIATSNGYVAQPLNHSYYRGKRPVTLLWDDPTWGKHFAPDSNISAEVATIIINQNNWGHVYGGNVIRTDGSGAFVKNALNNMPSPNGQANVADAYTAWPNCQGSCSMSYGDINPWDGRITNIPNLLDLLLQNQ